LLADAAIEAKTMLTVSYRSLSVAEKRAHEAAAAYHGQLWRLRLDRLVLMLGVCIILSSVVGVCLAGGLYLSGGRDSLLEVMPSFLLGCALITLVVSLASQHGVLNEHRHLSLRADIAQRALQTGRIEDLQVTLSSEDVRLDHEHGCIFIVSDGGGGSLVLSVSSATDDDRAIVLPDLAPRRVWSWSRAPDTLEVRDFTARGEREELLCWPYLDQVGMEAAAEALGVPSFEDMMRLPISPIAALALLYPLTPIREAA